MTLADLTRGQWGVVEMVSAEAVLRQRLFDLGLVPGTLVQVRFIGRKGNLAAYYVRGSVLALRRSTAQQVLIRSEGDSR
ncbi:MAG TPA: ferrous iron transport protein A [Firmicutes bacterium]|nr:ferrous iron transport protein A [Bacillota bacterium]